MTLRRGFGSIRKLPSGRFQAHYTGPDTARHNAPHTFETRMDAEGWLYDQRGKVAGDDWEPPAIRKRERAATFSDYATAWLEMREVKPTTRQLYESLLRVHVTPTFGDMALAAITPLLVKQWYSKLDTGPMAKANAYGLLRTILGDAVDKDVISKNPARIKGAGAKRRHRELRVLTIDEFERIVTAVPAR